VSKSINVKLALDFHLHEIHNSNETGIAERFQSDMGFLSVSDLGRLAICINQRSLFIKEIGYCISTIFEGVLRCRNTYLTHLLQLANGQRDLDSLLHSAMVTSWKPMVH